MRLQTAFLLAFLGLSTSPVASIAVLPVVGSHRSNVAITSALLTDTGRLDALANDGRVRSIMVSGFYPVSDCRRKETEPYMPPATATFQGDKFAAYGLPNGSFQSLSLETCKKSAGRSRCSLNTLPLVLFSGALGTSRLLYSSMLQSVAAAGYLVISVDHPYDSDVVEFPNGTIISGVDIDSDADVELTLNTRAEDIAFVHQQMANTSVTEKIFPGYQNGRRVPKTAIVGHSLGGAAAATTMLKVPSIRGGFNIDGSMFGSVVAAGLDRPFMLMGHENKTQETDPSWKAIWPRLRGWKKEFEVRGAVHYGFSDLPLITSVLDLQDKLPAEFGQVLGSVEGRRMMEITVSYVTAFLDMVLKSGSWDMSVGEFLEVVEVA